jgi:squalene-associated FAD-dependent desaturase
MGSDYDVAILGGGFAGLSAATALAERGCRVIVLEARPGLGGRATSFTDPATGERVDNGQHLLIGGYHETFKFLRRIGTSDAVRLQRHMAVDFIDRDGVSSRLQSIGLPPPLHLLAGIATWSALGWRDRLAALKIGVAIRKAASNFRAPTPGVGVQKLLEEPATVREWLERHGQTKRLIDLLWEPLAVATLNESIDLASPAPFLQVLVRMFTGDRQDAALALPLKPLDRLYAEPARAFVEARDGVVLVSAPGRISLNGDVAVTVRDQRIASRAVICAVAWYALPDVLPSIPSLRDTIESARSTPESPIVTVNVWLDRQVLPGEFLGLPGRSMQWAFDKRALFGDGSSHLSLVSSAASDLVARPNAEIVEIALSELRAALPAMRAAQVRRAVAVREKRATFSVAQGRPPRPATRTAVEGLFLAGDWIDTGLPATIESAVVSGHAAAEAALHFLDT